MLVLINIIIQILKVIGQRLCFRAGQAVSSGGTHSALLRSTLLPSPASSLPRELVSGRHLPLPEAVGWPRPPELTACPAYTLPFA